MLLYLILFNIFSILLLKIYLFKIVLWFGVLFNFGFFIVFLILKNLLFFLDLFNGEIMLYFDILLLYIDCIFSMFEFVL